MSKVGGQRDPGVKGQRGRGIKDFKSQIGNRKSPRLRYSITSGGGCGWGGADRAVSLSREERFEELVEAVQGCTLCPVISDRSKVLSRRNGSLEARVMFVAEAPGRLGADRTGVPLFGDRAGRNFQTLIEHVGWDREDLFVTNAVLCNPRTPEGNNRRPRRTEIANCSRYLKRTIDIIQPDVVVALGGIVLVSLRICSPHDAVLKSHVGTAVAWYDRTLVPLYHPGPRALLHRRFTRQKRDYMWLRDFVRSAEGLRRPRNS